ncbi:hypothetical protein ScPMuIL_007469 [Solemya velum]
MPGHTKVSDSEYDSYHDFVTNLLKFFIIGEDGINFGYIIYGRLPITVASLKEVRNKQRTKSGIADLTRTHILNMMGSSQNIPVLLGEIQQEFNMAKRKTVLKIAIILSCDGLDGMEETPTRITLNRMHMSGIFVMVIQKKLNSHGHFEQIIPTKFCRTIFVNNFETDLRSKFEDVWRILCGDLAGIQYVKYPNCLPFPGCGIKKFQPHPIDCDKFIHCRDGIPSVVDCSAVPSVAILEHDICGCSSIE